MNRFITTVFLILLTGQLYSQPGGGGGLSIGGIYNTKYKKIDLLNDTALKIRTFLLLDNKIYQETFVYQTLLANKDKREFLIDHLDLPPARDLDNDEYLNRHSDQRMYILYRKDTMIIDFIGIIGENGMGLSDEMESLVILPGYYKYYRVGSGSSYTEDERKNSVYLSKGLTFYTLEYLQSVGYIEYSPIIDISFLQEENLPASYYQQKAKYLLRYGEANAALPVLDRAVAKNKGKVDCKIWFLYTDAYTETKQYEKAVESISHAMAMDCKPYRWGWDGEIVNFRTRALLYIKMGSLDRALADYNTLVVFSLDPLSANIERAIFKMNYLQDYRGAIRDMKKDLVKISYNYLENNPQGAGEYCDTYFTLALVQYHSGELRSAWMNWLKAMEYGYTANRRNDVVLHFDTIIRKHPGIPELYLSRAFAYYKNAMDFHGNDYTNRCLLNALNDLSKAEALGLTNFKINRLRAFALKYLKQYDEALKEINITLKKNDKDADSYWLRYDIRRRMGLVSGDDDPDLLMYNRLRKEWESDE